MGLKIEYLNREEIQPYKNNAKKHPKEQIDQIKKSIEQFGFNDPIAIWKDNVIIEGHGRLLAAAELGMDKIPVIRLDNLSNTERKAYMLAHNKLTMNSDFDIDILRMELDEIAGEINMADFGFLDAVDVDSQDSTYTNKADIPQYEIQGDPVSLNDLYDDTKTKELIEEIENCDLKEEEKKFLTLAAYRHIVFDYRNIAEYYAVASKPVQELMERSALVIIDYDSAIANGYAKLKARLKELGYEG